jgi:hypothetical protein
MLRGNMKIKWKIDGHGKKAVVYIQVPKNYA